MVNVRPVGNDFALEFICEDGTRDKGLAMIAIASPDAIAQIGAAASKLAKGIANAPPHILGRTDSTGLQSAQPPLRVSHCVFAKVGDVTTASFAFVHPGMLHSLGSEDQKEPLRITVLFEVSLHISQFLHLQKRLESLNGNGK